MAEVVAPTPCVRRTCRACERCSSPGWGGDAGAGPTPGAALAAARGPRPGLTEADWVSGTPSGRAAGPGSGCPCPRGEARGGLAPVTFQRQRGAARGSLGPEGCAVLLRGCTQRPWSGTATESSWGCPGPRDGDRNERRPVPLLSEKCQGACPGLLRWLGLPLGIPSARRASCAPAPGDSESVAALGSARGPETLNTLQVHARLPWASPSPSRLIPGDPLTRLQRSRGPRRFGTLGAL